MSPEEQYKLLLQKQMKQHTEDITKLTHLTEKVANRLDPIADKEAQLLAGVDGSPIVQAVLEEKKPLVEQVTSGPMAQPIQIILSHMPSFAELIHSARVAEAESNLTLQKGRSRLEVLTKSPDSRQERLRRAVTMTEEHVKKKFKTRQDLEEALSDLKGKLVNQRKAAALSEQAIKLSDDPTPVKTQRLQDVKIRLREQEYEASIMESVLNNWDKSEQDSSTSSEK